MICLIFAGWVEVCNPTFRKPDGCESGLLVIARQSGDKEETDRLCKKLMTKKNHKPTIFNCGLHEWQSNKNAAKARLLINKALKLRGGSQDWDEKGYKVLNGIRG